jgi:predicted RNA-binding protein with TRAM domain
VIGVVLLVRSFGCHPGGPGRIEVGFGVFTREAEFGAVVPVQMALQVSVLARAHVHELFAVHTL